MNRSTMLLAAAAALAATAATVSFPAFAGTPTPTTMVRYADLNLATSGGAATLKARVNRAAEAVCANDGDKSLIARAESVKCAKLSAARAMPQVELALANAGTQLAENGHVSVAAR